MRNFITYSSKHLLMKKKLFLLRHALIAIFLLAFSNRMLAQVQAQNTSLTNIDANQAAFTATYHSDDVFTFYGSRNMSAGGNVKFASDWLTGNVLFKSGKQMNNAELEFDVSINELHFRQDNKTLLFTEPVKEFSLSALLHSGLRTFHFKSGYPEYGKQNQHTFYLVLAPGTRYELLKFLGTTVNENYQYNGGTERTYKVVEDLYVYDVASNKLMLLPSKSPKAFKKVLPQYESTIEKAAGDKKDKHWTEEEMISLVDELNK
jgi:hypothetical protein